MKKILYCIVLFFIFYGNFLLGISVEALVDSREVIAGGRIALTLTTNTKGRIVLLKQPTIANARWLRGESNITQVINGEVSSSTTYQLLATAPGEIVIPPLDVRVGQEQLKTDEITVKVLPPSDVKLPDDSSPGESLKDSVFANGRILSDQKFFYVGEEIPLELTVYHRPQLEVRFSNYPLITLDKALFRDYSQMNGDSSRFPPPQFGEVTIQNQSFQAIRFRTSFQMISSGDYKMDVRIPCVILISNRQKSNDPWDFFGSNYQRYPYELTVDVPSFQVKPLPPAPADVLTTGLVGSWSIEYQPTSERWQVGEPITLRVMLRGNGSLDNLTAPVLINPNYRIYPPEIIRQNDAVPGIIQYTLIPLKEGKADFSFTMAVFDTAAGVYQKYPFHYEGDVAPPAPGNDIASRVNNAVPDEPSITAQESTEHPKRNTILYLKQTPGNAVVLPLYRNHLLWYLFFLLLGPILFGAVEWRRFRNLHLNGNEAMRRRQQALKQRKKLFHAIRSAETDEEINNLIHRDVCSFLNDYFDFAPGTGAGELAEKANDPDLAECLKNTESNRYMPGAAPPLPTGELKGKLLKVLKKYSLFILLPLWLATPAAHAVETEFETALTSYDKADYHAAATYFHNELKNTAPQSNLLYNLGCALCQNGNYAEALLAFEQAKLLSPRDSAILENLNFVRRKLFLPEIGNIDHPGDLLLFLRDFLRPDQWGMVAVVFWSGAFVLLLLRRRLGVGKLAAMTGGCVLVILLSLSAIYAQYQGPYNPDRALTIQNHTPLRTLPSESAGTMEQSLPAGTPVMILEQRGDYFRIQSNLSEGWVKKEAIARVFGERQLTLPVPSQ